MNRIKTDSRLPEHLFTVLIYLFVGLFAIFCLLPFWMMVISSFTVETSLRTLGFQLFPTRLSLAAYGFLLSGAQIWRSYIVTITVTAIGTILALFVTSTYSYVLAHPKAKYRNILAFLTYFTMLFGAGLVGFYMLIARWLNLKDTLWAMILPYLLNPFYAFLMVSFLRTLPYELNEAAIVDGANEFVVFTRITMPIAKPALATVGLFYALQYWNDWWLALLFIDNYKLHPLQIMIRQLLARVQLTLYLGMARADYGQILPTYGVQLATVCLTIGPIILLYPFVQRYFIQGITVGSLKG